MNYIIGIDIGTTNSKAVAFSHDGKVLAQANSTYSPISAQEGYHELDPLVLLNAVTGIIRKITDACGNHSLSAISFSSAMHGLIAVDASGKPLTRMITWADLRSSAYAKALKDDGRAAVIYQETGTPVHAMTPLCKLMWMKDHLPDIFRAAAKFISIKEFVFFHFFGRYVIDHSVASSTGLFDIHKLRWSDEALTAAGIDPSRLSEHVPADSIITGLAPGIAASVNVPQNTPFIIGGSDGCMAHIGSNAIRDGEVSLTIGTSGAIRIMTPKPVPDPQQRIFNYLITDDHYLTGGPVNNGGNVLQWFAKNFLRKNLLTTDEMESFIREAISVKPGSEGLVFLPYIHGERAPVWDADARGIFFGVSASHTISHFMRAAIEGVAFALFSILDSIEEIIGPVGDIHASGGFIRSKPWVSLLADVLGKKLYVTHAEDSSAAGAAILGLKALGVIDSWENAKSFFTEKESYEPDMSRHAVYLSNYKVYSNLYDKFRDIKK